MQSRIKLLPSHVANQIAAGEVVQRPASVAKELMENALDAGATEIKLIVKDGGKALIQVIDNGTGMNEVDARMSFERHATSKILTAEDLSHIQTKGFRGEALASIAAVAHVELKTKTAEDELGTYIHTEANKLISQKPVATTKGTILSVKNLFFNIPARRKFLKSIQVEMRHVTDEFHRLALAHPQIVFHLIHNGNTIYQLPKSNHLQRISNIFGSRLKERLVPVKEETDYVKIYGFVGKPEFVKLKRGEQFFFVNDRFIKSPYLHHALLSAYEGLIKPKSYPSYFVYFEIDPEHIDVNIHPTKTEIKFDDEPTVYSILRVAARHSLGQFNLSPSIDFERDSSLDVPYDYVKKTPRTPKINVDPDFNPFEEEKKSKPNFLHKIKQEKTIFWDGLQSETQELSGQLEQDIAQEQLFESEVGQEHVSFQYLNKYIVTTHKDKLVFIHQNRAHQLVLFQQLMKQKEQNKFNAQQLIFPIELELQPYEIELLKTREELLTSFGFDVEYQQKFILIKSIPFEQKTLDITTIFQGLIKNLSLDIPMDVQQIEVDFAQNIAEKTAVQSGTKMNKPEMDALISDLFGLNNAVFSPKGKRIFVSLSGIEIENKLNR